MGKRGVGAFKANLDAASLAITQMRKIKPAAPAAPATPATPVKAQNAPEAATPAPAHTPATGCTSKSKLACR